MEGFDRRYILEDESKNEYLANCKHMWNNWGTDECYKVQAAIAGFNRAVPLTTHLAKQGINCPNYLSEKAIYLEDKSTIITIYKQIEGRQKLAHTLIKDKESCQTIGKELAKMHMAAKKFMIECPEQAQEFPMEATDESEKVKLCIPQEREHFGLIHGDFNINAIRMSSNKHMSIQNFENARHGFYLEDLGNFIFDISFRLEELALLGEEMEVTAKQ